MTTWERKFRSVYFADKNGKVGYLNTSGEEIVPAQFDYLYSDSDLGWAEDFYDDGYTIIRMGDVCGVIDKTGKYIINCSLIETSLWTFELVQFPIFSSGFIL